jgi:hypothetical protein
VGGWVGVGVIHITILVEVQLNIMVKHLALVLCIQEVLASNIGLDTSYLEVVFL